MPRFERRPWSTRLARQLRQNMTPEECRLWVCLHHDISWKFRRQEAIGPYICDFVCYAKRLVVEVDGVQHADSPEDAVRDAYLARAGFRVLRVWNSDVMLRLEEVLEQIAATLDERPDMRRNHPSGDAEE